MRAAVLTTLLILAAGIAASDAHGGASPVLKLQVERFTPAGHAQPVRGGRAVALTGRASLRRRVALFTISRLSLRARGVRCGGSPTLAVSIDGRRVAILSVRSTRWHTYDKDVSAHAGRRAVTIRLLNGRRGRGCRRGAVVDYLSVRGKAPVAPVTPAPPAPSAPAPIATAPAAPAAGPAPAPAAAGPTFANPVFGAFADPMALDVGGSHSNYYAYATGGGFPMARSSDLVHWTSAGTAMAGRPGWAQQTGDYNPWAPSVLQTDAPCPGAAQGPCFVMYFVSKHASMDPPANCIGVATSTTPAGPFADRGPLQYNAVPLDSSGRPVGCGDDGGYSNIDPAPFVDVDARGYLYLSTGHRCVSPTPHATCDWHRTISVIPLSADRLSAAGPRQPLFAADSAWEGSVVEGPWVRRRGGLYELCFSGGVFTGAYGMGYATASSPSGPFTKSPANPLLHDSADVKSAGGGSLVTGPRGGEWVIYHGRSGSYTADRVLRLDPVRIAADDSVAIDGPTTTPQPAP